MCTNVHTRIYIEREREKERNRERERERERERARERERERETEFMYNIPGRSLASVLVTTSYYCKHNFTRSLQIVLEAVVQTSGRQRHSVCQNLRIGWVRPPAPKNSNRLCI